MSEHARIRPSVARSASLTSSAPLHTLWRGLKRSVKWYPFILPQLLTFVAFNLTCWLALAYLSFTEWDMLSAPQFAGLNNYAAMLADHKLGIAVKNSFQYALMYVPPLAALSFIVALAVNRRLFAMPLFRSLYFLPVVTSVAVLAMIWWRIFSPRPNGPLNYLLGLMGIAPQGWLVDLKLAMPTIVGMGLWSRFGYFMVLWLAGLQGVPPEMYEAAQVDGAYGWRIHWHITLPLLRPTAAFILVISTIQALQVFGEIYILTGGGPVLATTTMVWHIWQYAFTLGKMGYASAMSVLLFVIILIITLIQRKYLRFGEELY